MKTKILIIGLLALICAGCEQKDSYEFHSGADGQILWRCNRKTGEVKIFTNYSTSYEIQKGAFCDYLINRQNGKTWRYYKNDTNSVPVEGFSPLPHAAPESMAEFLASLEVKQKEQDPLGLDSKPSLKTNDLGFIPDDKN